MTEVNPCGWLQNAGATHTAAQMRTYAGSLLAGLVSTGNITKTRGGVHPGLGGQLAVTANGTPNMSVNVAAGVIYIPGTESNSQGIYFCENDGSINLAIATAPGAGVSRIDVIVAKVQDSFYSGGTNAWHLAVVTGTAASTPGVPTIPANSISLAQVFVGSSVTSITTGNITDTRPFAAALGGIIPMLSTAPVAASSVYESCLGYYTDLNIPVVFDGTNWGPLNTVVQTVVYNATAATQTVTSTSYVNVTNVSVGFTKRFASTRLLCRLGISGAPTTVGNGVQVTCAINIAGADYDITGMYFNNNVSSSVSLPMGERYINNIAAGSRTAQARIKVSVNSWSMAAQDRISMSITECI